MSFLNPVNEPVLRFKSTDAGAPQINYNARVAGDIKAVLKACLVTGYGATASAGWSIVNEVNHVAEFVSPSAAMSDHKIGVDDTSTSSTTWYYKYQDARTNPSNNAIIKSLVNINKTHSSNGWQLLVTNRGICFIEFAYSTVINNLISRVTWMGQVKSALPDTGLVNIIFWSLGHNAADPDEFFIDDTKGRGLRYIALASYRDFDFAAIAMHAIQQKPRPNVTTHVNVMSEVYLTKDTTVIGQHPGLFFEASSANDSLGISDVTQPHPMLRVNVTWQGSTVGYYKDTSKPIYIRTDYWEY